MRSTELKMVNVSRFLADALSAQVGTLTEDELCDPDLIEGEVVIADLDFDDLLRSLVDYYGDHGESVEDLDGFKEAVEGHDKIFAYWES